MDTTGNARRVGLETSIQIDDKKEAARLRAREWRKNNLAREKENKKKYYAANKLEIIRKTKEYAAKNPHIHREANRNWRKRNPEKALRGVRVAYQKNRSARLEQKKTYYSENRHRWRAYFASYMAAKRMPTWADKRKIVEFYKQAKDLSESTGIKHHVDHIVPLRGRNVCGLHVENNLRVISATENLRKNNKWADDSVSQA